MLAACDYGEKRKFEPAREESNTTPTRVREGGSFALRGKDILIDILSRIHVGPHIGTRFHIRLYTYAHYTYAHYTYAHYTQLGLPLAHPPYHLPTHPLTHRGTHPPTRKRTHAHTYPPHNPTAPHPLAHTHSPCTIVQLLCEAMWPLHTTADLDTRHARYFTQAHPPRHPQVSWISHPDGPPPQVSMRTFLECCTRCST